MVVEILIYPDGKRTHEVVEREANENCDRIHSINTDGIVSDERTGPDCDRVEEIQS